MTNFEITGLSLPSCEAACKALSLLVQTTSHEITDLCLECHFKDTDSLKTVANEVKSSRYALHCWTPINDARNITGAAFPKIPQGEGVCVAMGGPTSTTGTQHNIFHQVLEDFWTLFRTGPRRGTTPTNKEYSEVLKQGLESSGFASDEASELVRLSEEARRTFGYFDGAKGLAPQIPQRMPLPR